MSHAALLLLAAVGQVARPVPPAASAEATRARVLMGTSCTARVHGRDENAAAAAAVAALDEVQRMEGVLSTWDPRAELAVANAAAQRGSASVSRELAAALQFALAQARRTGGAFEPAIGALVDAWDLRGAGRRPTAAELAAARRATGCGLVSLDAKARTLAFASAATWLDSGAFGKGLALDGAASAARTAGAESFLLDLGGQVMTGGAPPGASAWPVAVADPAERDRPALTLALRDASASTSGQSERFVRIGGRRFGHVLDPRTGAPVERAGSVTVVAPSAAEADALSTALLVMGPEEGLAFAARERLCAGFLVPSSRGRDRLELAATESFLALVAARDARVRIAPPPSRQSNTPWRSR